MRLFTLQTDLMFSSSYKLFALRQLNRLPKANANDQIWLTQFGFRNGARVTYVLFMAGRFIDKAHAIKHNNFVLGHGLKSEQGHSTTKGEWRQPLK